MGNYNFLYKHVVISTLLVFSNSYVYANGGQTPTFSIPSTQDFYDMYDGFKDRMAEVHKVSNRLQALKMSEECNPMTGDGVDESFCSAEYSKLRSQLLIKYNGIINNLVKQKVVEKIQECRVLLKARDNVHGRISEIKNDILGFDKEIADLIKELESPDVTGIEGSDADEKTKNFYAAQRKKLDDLEYKANLYKSFISYLSTGNGEPPDDGHSANLKTISEKLEAECSEVVVKPQDFAVDKTGARHSVKFDPVKPATQALVEAEVVSEIVEPSEDVDAERARIQEAIALSETEAREATDLIQGHSRKGEQTSGGVIPSINYAREIIASVERLARVPYDSRQDGGCGFSGCVEPKPPSGGGAGPAAGGGGAPPATQRKPNDGLAYGGNHPSDSSKGDTTTDNKGVMGKTSGNSGSGFSMPSFGGMGSVGGSKANGSSSTYYAKTDLNNAKTPSGFTRNWNGGSNTFKDLNNNTGASSRNPSSADGGSSNSAFYATGSNGGTPHANGAGLAVGNIAGQGGGDGARYNSSGKASSRRDKKGNKQLFTGKNEKASGLGLASREQDRKAALAERMERLKAESKLAGKDAFDPDKYIPKTAAEKIALARASGKVAGYMKGKEWPIDISRQKNQDIFNVMLKGYKKHLQENNL